jgi:hypothetical protein
VGDGAAGVPYRSRVPFRYGSWKGTSAFTGAPSVDLPSRLQLFRPAPVRHTLVLVTETAILRVHTPPLPASAGIKKPRELVDLPGRFCAACSPLRGTRLPCRPLTPGVSRVWTDFTVIRRP